MESANRFKFFKTGEKKHEKYFCGDFYDFTPGHSQC